MSRCLFQNPGQFCRKVAITDQNCHPGSLNWGASNLSVLAGVLQISSQFLSWKSPRGPRKCLGEELGALTGGGLALSVRCLPSWGCFLLHNGDTNLLGGWKLMNR